MECVMNYNRFFNPKIFYPIFILVCTTLFFSCENFLNGGDVKEAIDKAIYIANNECPVATLEEPIFTDEGLPKNRAICISFTKSMNPKNFDDYFDIKDSNNKSLKESFLAPQWSNDNKYVRIPANEQNLINLHNQPKMDIFVTLSKAFTTPDDLPLTQNINQKYRIKDDIDKTPPELTTVRAELPGKYTGKIDDENVIILQEGSISSLEKEENILAKNHIGTKLDFYIEGNDNGGGDVWGTVLYHQLFDAVGNAINATEESRIIKLNKKADEDNYYGTITLDLSNEKYSDGLYEVKVFVYDTYETISENTKTYNVIRDTTLAYSLNGKMNLMGYQFRSIDEIPENFDFSIQYLDWNDPKRKLPDITFNGDTFTDGIYNGPDSIGYYLSNSKEVPTAKLIETYSKRIFFDNIFDDVYYTSKVTGKTYSNNFRDFSYYLSWGTSLHDMKGLEKLELDSEYVPGEWMPERLFILPANCYTFLEENKDKDIYLTTTYVDTVGNKNTMTLVYPKIVDFHNFLVEDDPQNEGKKRVTLTFADMSKQAFTNFVDLPNKSVRVQYYIYYGEKINGIDDDLLELTRNPSKPWLYDPWCGETDSNVIKGLEPNKKYVVYIQAMYQTDSLLNSQYTGGLNGHLRKVIVDTALESGTIPEKPVFKVKKESAEINSGLYNLTITVTNPQSNVSYIPAYSINGTDWVFYDSKSDNNFIISVNNPLKMPIGVNEAWANETWDNTFRTSPWWGVETDEQGNKTGGWKDNNTYFIAVDNCRNRYGYPNVTAKLKLFAITDGEMTESDEKLVEFSEADDNIPPYVSNDISLHDSKLSFDGHSFKFANLVREDEGHLLEYYDYYYVPYEEMWGTNLNVLTEDQISNLPGGRASFTSSCWFDKNENKSGYNIDMSIPIYGLEDGKYMYFAKVSDSYGNYKYVTLGQANIGTFKNKLKVEYNEKTNHFISTLPLEQDETDFDRYMISVQRFGFEDKKNDYTWYNHYEWSNELQDCTLNEDKTILSNESGEGFFTANSSDTGWYELEKPRALDAYNYYRITIQAFNENTYDSSTGKGADRIYGRPYAKQLYTGDNAWKNYDHDIEGWINFESEYDACTDETVSNTVFMYIPPTREQDEWWYHEPVMSSFFVDTATPRSNKDYIVEVIASGRDLGNDIDEWERRGKIVKMHEYHTGLMVSGKYKLNDDYNPNEPETADNPKYILNPNYSGHDDYQDNPDYNTFNASVALEDMYNSKEKGLVYYVVIAHFADSSSAMSRVFTMQGF